MTTLLTAVFVSCLLAVVHSYVLYPYLTLRAAERRKKQRTGRQPSSPWPPVRVLMAVHNEEAVLPAKLASLSALDYPGELAFHIASDRSTDGTDRLLTEFAARHRCQLHFNDRRRGKPGSINDMVAGLPTRGVYVFTDASVMMQADTVTELVRPLVEDATVGLTDAVMVHTGVPGTGVGALEDSYIRREVQLKVAESTLWRRMVGPFGGCWAMRAEAYRPVPDNYLVDDFYLCMAAYENGWRGVTAERALAYEGVGVRLQDEFRRKRRIGAGNWQNLVRFRRLWWPPSAGGLSYALFSHKVLRWWSPLLLLTGGACLVALILLSGNYWTAAAFVGMTATLCVAVPALRYFVAMNAALLLGMVDYLKGIQTNVWQPSHRNQDAG